MINLSKEERIRFALYCEQEAESASLLAAQAEKLPFSSHIASILRAEAFAYTLVANKLKSTEEMTLTNPSPSNPPGTQV